ncbi:VOC family protein [Streptomyces cavernae]|uniref:VOC family protein n=1 Tax=Streptomyces cavernae TaxID=2259034 RepID=UPI000FEC10B8|nr:VOC family protein [Streptomyces cavernae]
MTEAPATAGRNGSAYAPGTPCWVSLMVHGLAATQEFYGELFGWEFQPGPQQLGPYVRALLHGDEVAGIGQLPPDRHLPVAWTPYLASSHVDLTAETVRHCGGTVGVGPLDAEHAGRMAIAADPSGAVFGIWQAAAHHGIGVYGVPGTPAWNELLTRDTASVTKFYRTVFGYEEEPVVSADFDYVTLALKGRPVAAVHGVGRGLPRDRGPHWMTHFEVADPDEAANRVIELGGHVVKPPRDTAHGRTATVADPEGAVFSVVHTGS